MEDFSFWGSVDSSKCGGDALLLSRFSSRVDKTFCILLLFFFFFTLYGKNRTLWEFLYFSKTFSNKMFLISQNVDKLLCVALFLLFSIIYIAKVFSHFFERHDLDWLFWFVCRCCDWHVDMWWKTCNLFIIKRGGRKSKTLQTTVLQHEVVFNNHSVIL